MRTILYILLMIFLSACGTKTFSEIDQDKEQDYQIRRMVELEDTSMQDRERNFRLATDISSFVHHVNKVRQSSPEFSSLSRVENIYRLINDPDYGHICGGIATSSVDILRAYGFKARLIQLFSSGPDGHVSTEVFINDKWIAIDPTFNAVFFNQDNVLLNYEEMIKMKREGRYSEIYIEYQRGGSRSKIEDYYFRYEDLLHTVRALPVFYRSTPSLNVYIEGQEIF